MTEDVLLSRIKEAATTAALPDGYQWGHDAMEQFAVGRRRAWEAIEPDVRALIGEVERLREALEPFAKIAEIQDERGSWSPDAFWSAGHEHFRRARQSLQGAGE